MSRVKPSLLSIATCLFGCLFLFPAVVFSQTKPEPSSEAQDVIKFETSLVQTDVMVFDKNGRFVDGLKPEQFQLKINNSRGKYPSSKQSNPAVTPANAKN